MIKLSKLSRTLPVFVLLAVLLILGACSRNPELRIDGTVPDFKLQDINDQTISLKDYQGKAVLIHFWDTTFDICVNEMPHFQALHEDWTQSGKAVLLTIDATETAATLKSFMESHNYTFPVLLDSEYQSSWKI